MLTESQIENITKRISSVIGDKVYLYKNNDNEIKNKKNRYELIIDNEIYTMIIENSELLSLREKKVIEYLVKEIVGIESNRREEDLIRATKENLDNKTLKKIIENHGFEIDKDMTVILIRLSQNSIRNDVGFIINNISLEYSINAILEDDLMMIIHQQKKEDSVELAKNIVNTVETELFEKINIGISTSKSSYEIKHLYEEALESLEIGIEYKIPSSIFLFKELLMIRMISNLSEKKLADLYTEALDSGFNRLTQEEIKTATLFIDNNLNVSEAARRLYIHRNTLIYRLDKILKDTGFDIKLFHDASKFEILLIIYRYMKEKPR